VIVRLVIGLGVAAFVSLAGARAGALSGSGALAAIAVGTAVILGTSWPGAVVLGVFFVSSSALSRLGRPTGIAAKGSQRDAPQVLANGGVAALGGLAGLWFDGLLALALVAGALGAAAADTWATEVGSRSRTPPRLLIAWRVTAPGTSGGVTALGSLAALAGALLLGVCSSLLALLRFDAPAAGALAIGVTVGGVCGSFVDTLTGELLQERRYCPDCRQATEALVHRCGTPTLRTGGLPHLDNDAVNVLCTLTGALAAGLILILSR
jgi:uncharacterized protein (TIGR00297 family)